MKQIKYRSGYKYQLVETYSTKTAVYPVNNIHAKYLSLSTSGVLTIRSGYAWDGPSGPTFDTKTFMRGALVHDALYELMRQGYLSKTYRSAADNELKKICLEDGMCRLRAWYVHKGVSKHAEFAVEQKAIKKIQTAP